MKHYKLGCEVKDRGAGPSYHIRYVMAESDEEAIKAGYSGSGVEDVEIIDVVEV